MALQLLRSIRSAAFPNNALAPGRVPPSIDEIAIIKHDCAAFIIDAIPEVVRRSYFGSTDRDLMQKDVERTLDLFGEGYINKHFIIGALELMTVRLFPELAIAADSTE
ncbi:hypothetical protein LTR86_010308 [Recurvomyces mirabilis]|nr:hypothetical protein LTR86_010308 [Recurvomyces mirabilis]